MSMSISEGSSSVEQAGGSGETSQSGGRNTGLTTRLLQLSSQQGNVGGKSR